MSSTPASLLISSLDTISLQTDCARTRLSEFVQVLPSQNWQGEHFIPLLPQEYCDLQRLPLHEQDINLAMIACGAGAFLSSSSVSIPSLNPHKKNNILTVVCLLHRQVIVLAL